MLLSDIYSSSIFWSVYFLRARWFTEWAIGRWLTKIFVGGRATHPDRPCLLKMHAMLQITLLKVFRCAVRCAFCMILPDLGVLKTILCVRWCVIATFLCLKRQSVPGGPIWGRKWAKIEQNNKRMRKNVEMFLSCPPEVDSGDAPV